LQRGGTVDDLASTVPMRRIGQAEIAGCFLCSDAAITGQPLIVDGGFTVNCDRIPERVVHAKVQGAYDTFTVTNDNTRASISGDNGRA